MLDAGKSVGEVVQALEVSEATLHRWRNQYGGMKSEEAKRLKELEEENKKLKRLLADAELDKLILKEALKGNY
jgi:putative transposase